MKKMTKKAENGRKTKSISTEMTRLIASVANDITIQNYGNVLRPQDATLFAKGNGRGLRLYEEVEKDGRVKALLEKRKAKVTSREWVVKAADDDNAQAQAAAQLLEKALKGNSL